MTVDPARVLGSDPYRSPSLGRGAPIEAVLFDYGLTLVHFVRPVEALAAARVAISELIAAAGHPRCPEALIAEAVHDRVAAELASHEASGALEEIDVAALEERAFADIGLDLSPNLRDQCSVLAQEAWWRGVHLYPDALDVLDQLRSAGLRVGLCSNAAYRAASMRAQLAHVGLDGVLDAAVFSAEVGWRKPSPQVFAAALDALGTRAETTVFVGDRIREDILGAAQVGMRTVLIARDESAAIGPRLREPNAVVNSLSELPTLLRVRHL